MSSSSSSENIPPPRSGSPGRIGKSTRSPPRRPLHERSNSQANETLGPTIRIVEESDTDVYSKSPYPSHPSHILRPSNAGRGYVFEDREPSVSDQPSTSSVPHATGIPSTHHTLVPKPLQLRKPNRTSASTSTSDETAFSGSTFSPSSPRYSQDTSPPASPVLHAGERTLSLDFVKEESSDTPSGNSPPSRSSSRPPSRPHSRPTVRAIVASIEETLPPQLNTQSSIASLRSSTSDASTIHIHEKSSNASSSDLPLPSQPLRRAKRPFYAHPRSKKQASATQSSESLISSAESSNDPQSSQVSLTHVALQATTHTATRVQYPVIRPPQASGTWAESQTSSDPSSSRMTERTSGHKWSSQLSTIHSESEQGSQSISEQSHFSGRNNTGARITSFPSLQTASLSSPSLTSIQAPEPLITRQRPADGRDSDEHLDLVSELYSPPLRPQRSGYFSRYSSDGRPSSSRSRPSSSRPSSSSSDIANFIANTIPAWARVYYRAGDRSSLPAPDSSTEASESRLNTQQSGPSLSPTESHFPLSIYRPRTRTNRRSHAYAESNPDVSRNGQGQDIYAVGPVRGTLRSRMGTPHLYPDRRSTAHLSAFKAPSFNDSLGTLFSRENRQILLFGIGFIFPLAWIIGALLPLPLPPELSKEATPSQLDVERVMVRNVGHIDEIRYHKSRWWRNLNRVFSFVGVLLIGAIIALAIVAANMQRASRQ